MTTHPSIEEFKSKGWYLSPEGIELIASKNEDLKTIDDYVRHAKDLDIASLTKHGLSQTNEKLKEIPSPAVLQLVKVSYVAENEGDQPRLLDVTFTDGTRKRFKATHVNESANGLKIYTPPGTKFLVTKPIPINDQMLSLQPGMMKKLGGHVQELVQVWKKSKPRGRNRHKDVSPMSKTNSQTTENKTVHGTGKTGTKPKKEDLVDTKEDKKDEEERERRKTRRNKRRSSNKKNDEQKLHQSEEEIMEPLKSDDQNKLQEEQGVSEEKVQEKERTFEKKKRPKKKKSLIVKKTSDAMHPIEKANESSNAPENKERLEKQKNESKNINDRDDNHSKQEEPGKKKRTKKTKAPREKNPNVNAVKDEESKKTIETKVHGKIKKLENENKPKAVADKETDQQPKTLDKKKKKSREQKKNSVENIDKASSLPNDEEKGSANDVPKRDRLDPQLVKVNEDEKTERDNTKAEKKMKKKKIRTNKREREHPVNPEKLEQMKKQENLNDSIQQDEPIQPKGTKLTTEESPEKQPSLVSDKTFTPKSNMNDKTSIRHESSTSAMIAATMDHQQPSKVEALNDQMTADSQYRMAYGYQQQQQQLQQQQQQQQQQQPPQQQPSTYNFVPQAYPLLHQQPAPATVMQNGYYYQQPYSMGDYNMVMPVYPNYNYPPSTEQYMQPIYYHQPYNNYQPYYNHHSYYNTNNNNYQK